MPSLPDNIRQTNARSLQRLVRSIRLDQGDFSLILVRCNYVRLRRMILEHVQETVPMALREVKVTAATQSLYQAIQNAVGQTVEPPQVVMVTGLESVPHLAALLSSANLVRDEFRKNFPFALVLWTNDPVFQTLTEFAQDLKSFAAGAIPFQFPVDELIASLRQYADQLFETLLYAAGDRFLPNSALKLATGSRLRTELEAALKDIRKGGETLDRELQASIDFLRGRDAQARLEMEQAKTFYEQSLAFWQAASEGSIELIDCPPAAQRLALQRYRERQACLLFHLGSWWRRAARMRRSNYRGALLEAKRYFQVCLAIFREDGRLDLVARFITALGETLQRLKEWQELEVFARAGLSLHQLYLDPLRLARDYGLLAEVALARSPQTAANWTESKIYAEQALEILDRVEQEAGKILTQLPMTKEAGQDSQEGSYKTLSNPGNRSVFNTTPSIWEESGLALAERVHRGWYLLLLARSLEHLADREQAIARLEEALKCSSAEADPTLYIEILQALESLYFKQERYLPAFHVKQQKQIIQQQYGFTAFVGASRLAPRQIDHQAEVAPSVVEAVVMQEIAASGRQQDVNRLLARMSLPKDKLTVIHGASGVGKSSILTVGLVPALQQKRTIEARQILPVLVSVYNDWVSSVERRINQELNALEEAIAPANPAASPLPPASGPVLSGSNSQSLLDQLRQNRDRNLYTVLIFDQFEEFFFAYPHISQRRSFYLFLKECLNIAYVKVILSLREDYLHYLLEIDRVASLDVINHDILSKQIRYALGDFSPADARTVIHSLTERSQFALEDSLIDRLVQDLAGDLGGVRPIELQVVGAQLQAEGITTLAQYERLGAHPKETLVQRSLEDVIDDCGEPNEPIAQAVLFLLTNADETRPLKTRAELSEELMLAEMPCSDEQLDLVLEILVGSGLVVKIPEEPAPLHQLVHDYLVRFIREQHDFDLLERIAEVEAEKASVEAQRDQLAAANAELDQANQQLDRTNQELGQANQELDQARQQERRVRTRTAVASAALVSLAAGLAIFLARDAYIAEQEARLAEQQRMDAVLATQEAERRQQEVNQSAQKAIAQAQQAVTVALSQRQQAQQAVNQAKQQLATAQTNLQQLSRGARQAAQARQQAEARVKAAEAKLMQAEGQLAQASQAVTLAQVERQKARLAQQEAVKGTKLERAGVAALQQFQFSQLEALVAAVKAGKELQAIVQDGRPLNQYPAASPLLALQAITDTIREQTQVGNSQGKIWQVLFSPDREQFVTSGTDNTMQFWDLQGKRLGSLQTGYASFLAAELSPEGELILTIGRDSGSAAGSVRLWTAQGQLLAELPHAGDVNIAQFSPDGQRILTAGADGWVRVWNRQGQPLFEFEAEPEGGLQSIQLSSKAIATLGDSSTVRLWDWQGNPLAQLPSPGGAVFGMQFSPNGQLLATLGADNTARLWAQGQLQATLQGHQGLITSLQFSPDSQFVATSSRDGTAQVWNLQGQSIAVVRGHRGEVSSVLFSPDQQLLATRGEDNTVRLWDRQGNPVAILRGHRGKILSLQFSPDGRRLLTGGADGTARLWTVGSNPAVELTASTRSPYGKILLQFSPDGQRLATGRMDGSVQLWNLQGRAIADVLGGVGERVQAVQFSPNGQRLATVSSTFSSTIVRLWDGQGNLVTKLPEQRGSGMDADASFGLQFSPDGQRLAILLPNATLRIWNFQTNAFEADLPDQISIQFSPDGTRFATIDRTGLARLWDRQGYLIQDFSQRRQMVSALRFSPDGQSLALATSGGTVGLWNLQGQLLREFRGHRGNVLAVQFSADGQRLATSGVDGTARLWDLQGGQLEEFRGHQGDVSNVQFSPSGDRLATTGEDNTLRLWGLQGQQIAQYEGNTAFLSPDWRYVATASRSDGNSPNRLRLWQVNDLDGLLMKSCKWLTNYLIYAPGLSQSDRALCQGVESRN